MAIFLVRFRVFSVMSAVPALWRRPGERVATESGERDSVYMNHVGGAGVRRVATEGAEGYLELGNLVAMDNQLRAVVYVLACMIR
jgi:hypothetical protein